MIDNKLKVELGRLLRKSASELVDVTDERNVEELDSLAIVELISFVEEEFSVTLRFEDLRKAKTVRDITVMVENTAATS